MYGRTRKKSGTTLNSRGASSSAHSPGFVSTKSSIVDGDLRSETPRDLSDCHNASAVKAYSRLNTNRPTFWVARTPNSVKVGACGCLFQVSRCARYVTVVPGSAFCTD